MYLSFVSFCFSFFFSWIMNLSMLRVTEVSFQRLVCSKLVRTKKNRAEKRAGGRVLLGRPTLRKSGLEAHTSPLDIGDDFYHLSHLSCGQNFTPETRGERKQGSTSVQD